MSLNSLTLEDESESSNPEISETIKTTTINTDVIAIEEIPSADFIHRCTFSYPNQYDFISNQFQSAKGLAMSVFWNKYSDDQTTHQKGESLYLQRVTNNPDIEKYIGFTKTLVDNIRNITSKDDAGAIQYKVDVIHCPDDGIAVDIAHAHIQMFDVNSIVPKKIPKNHRMRLVDQILKTINDSIFVNKT